MIDPVACLMYRSRHISVLLLLLALLKLLYNYGRRHNELRNLHTGEATTAPEINCFKNDILGEL